MLDPNVLLYPSNHSQHALSDCVGEAVFRPAFCSAANTKVLNMPDAEQVQPR